MQFSLLGPLEVSADDGPLDLGGPRQRTILAYLLLRFGRLVQADDLIDNVWGDDAPAAVRASLHSYISRLRKLLGAERIESRAGGYALLADPDEVDATMFERLVEQARSVVATDAPAAVRLYDRAERLWRGPALADLRDHLALRADATRLDDLRLTAIEERLRAELTLGRHAELVPQLELLVERHPAREVLWRHLMVALYRSGRQSEGLAAYHALRTELSARFGIDPSPEAERLQRRMLDQDPALDLGGEPLRGYRLVQPLGRGSVGVVHRAVQPHMDRPVAVKVIAADLADDPAFIRQFETQARRIARLEHPHIAPIHDYWREPGAAYVVTPLFEGGSLGDALDGGSLAAPSIMGLVEQVASALSFAHRQGVVHGNLHARNVLLDRDGNAYVSDFAAELHGLQGHPERMTAPSPHLAPEVTDGEPATPLSDVFSLGRLVVSLAVVLADEQLLELGRRATARDPSTRPGAVDDLLSRLVQLDADRGLGRAAVALAASARNPYRGLLPFRSEDARDFFGRDALIDEVVGRLGAGERFLAVVGPSGSGKSSLVRAGVVPALAGGATPGSDEWFVADLVPGDSPFTELNEAIRAIARTPDWMPVSPVKHDVAATLGDALGGTDAPVLLHVDQFEELFTLVDDEDERRAFVEAILGAVSDPGGRVRVVVTLRADHYDRPLEHPGLADLTIAGTLGVPPLTAEELGAAIAGPANAVGVEVDPALVARLTADLVSEPGALPLLQYSLTEAFDRREGAALDLNAYEEVGGLAGALTHRAEGLWEALAPAARATAPRVFLRLVALSDTGASRRRATRRELVEAADDPTVVEQLLTTFGNARLLSFDRDPVTRAPTVEVAHESLLRSWERLRRWIAEARQDLVVQQQLARAAAEWHDAGREPSYLAMGSRLDQLDAWRLATTVGLSSVEADFLSESVAARERQAEEEARRAARERDLEQRSDRRRRVVVATLAATALLGTVLTAYAVDQRGDAERQSRIATARELAAASMAVRSTDTQQSLLLALEAVDVTRSNGEAVVAEAEEALHHAVLSSRAVARIPGVGGHVSVSPDGTMLVTEGPEETGLIDIRDLTTGESIRAFVGHDRRGDGGAPDVNAVAFSPDGERLATTGDDGTLRVWGDVWRTDVGEPELLVGEQPGDVWSPAFSPSGDLVAAAWRTEGQVRVVDVTSGSTVLEISLPDPVGVAFSPDGSRLAILDLQGVGRVVTVEGGEELVRFGEGWGSDPNAVAFSPDGRWLASANWVDASIYDASTGELEATVSMDAPVLDIAWSPDSTRLAAGDVGGTARVWEVEPDEGRTRLSHEFAESPAGPISGVAFAADGDHLVAGAEGDVDRVASWVWDLRTSSVGEVLTVEGPGPPPRVGATFVDDDTVAVVSGADGEITTWDTSGRMPLEERTPGATTLIVEDGFLDDLEVTADGRRIAWVAAGEVVVQDVREGRELLRAGAERGVNSVALTSTGSHVALGGMGLVQVVEVDSGARTSLTIRDADGEEQPRFRTHVSFSPDGSLLAVGGSDDRDSLAGRVELWDWRDREVVATLDTVNMQPVFAPDGTWLAVGGGPDVEVFDVESSDRIARLRSGLGEANELAVSPDGDTIATAGRSGTIRLWDVATQRLRLELPPHDDQVWALGFDHDGSRLVSTDVRGEVRVWTLDVDELIGMAERELTTHLSSGECVQLLGADTCADV